MNEPSGSPIQSLADLKQYLQAAIQLEHATIPPYLTALYSIKMDQQQSNLDVYNIIRAVLVEEMLHMTLAANMLNAIDGTPNLLGPKFVPNYPAYLPTGEKDFEVGIAAFSKATIDTFLQIERPAQPATGSQHHFINGICYVHHEQLAAGRKSGRGLLPSYKVSTEGGGEEEYHYYSIGEFYKAILKGFEYLVKRDGEKAVFIDDQAKQIGPEYFHSAGGEINKVTDLASVREAIDLICEQGEGGTGRIYDDEGELSHYYRYDQIKQGRFYQIETDQPGVPTGSPFQVYWNQVYPVKQNLKLAEIPDGELKETARKFNRQYRDFLGLIHRALNGEPRLLMPAFASMFKIKESALELIHNPLPGTEFHASPTFEIDEA